MRAHLASLVEEFREHAAETAVVAHRGVRRYATTYGELGELAGRFAAELERRGVGPGERVVLWGADSAEWIGVFFGCLLRGVMVVPLDAAGDAGFAGRVVRDVGARLVVGDSHLLREMEAAAEGVGGAEEGVPQGLKPQYPGGAGRPEAKASGYQDAKGTEETQDSSPGLPPSHYVEAGDVPRMELRGIGERLTGEPLWAVSAGVGLDTPFQIVFTSGTTREPRGIVHTHRNVLVTLDPIEREIAKYRRLERVFHPLRFLHSLPLSHVFGQFMGLWCPALLAAEVHFAEQLEPARVVELIKRERISVLVAVPRVLELLRVHLLARFEVRGSRFEGQMGGGVWAVVRKWWRGRRVHRALGWKFWAVISGGATLPRELEAFWSGLGVALIQGYGMTETTALVTLNHPFHIKQGTIGKTLPGREVKIGADGEILVRGDVVAGATWERGAMRRREGEWLATGDLAETGAEGELKFVGRKGDAIVTGAGMNVHPADLEAALAGQAGVRGCVVVGCEFSSGPEAVAVVLFSGTAAELAAAVKEANRGLAQYQQIRRWVRWPELTFPYTSTGKLIRRKVAEWVSGVMGVKSAASDRNATGKATTEILSVAQNDGANTSAAGDGVVGVIEEVTGEAVTGDSLRLGEDLKLDSLGRVQLQSALEQRFDVELEEDAMAAVETVGELRRMVEEQVVGGQLAEVGSKAVDGRRGAEGKEGRPQGLKPADFGVSIGTAEAVPLSKTGSAAGLEAEALARPPAKAGEEMVYPRWAWWRWVRWVRVAWIEGVMRPLVWVLARPRVMYVTGEGTNTKGADGLVTVEGTNTGILSGAQNDEQERGTNAGIVSFAQNDELNGDEPLLIICNHVTAFDGALVLYALPGRVRRRVACAMSGEMLMDYRRARGQGNWVLNVLAPGAYWLLTALFNVFPLPRARGFRRSFAHAGEAMDRGYSVLVFPEGSRSRDGKMHGFRPGIGLLAKEAGAAILPVGLRGLYELTGAEEPRRRWFHAGKIEVRVGAVVGAADEASDPAEVTARLAAAVRGLVEEPWSVVSGK